MALHLMSNSSEQGIFCGRDDDEALGQANKLVDVAHEDYNKPTRNHETPTSGRAYWATTRQPTYRAGTLPGPNIFLRKVSLLKDQKLKTQTSAEDDAKGLPCGIRKLSSTVQLSSSR
jgi:hypothetical protein